MLAGCIPPQGWTALRGDGFVGKMTNMDGSRCPLGLHPVWRGIGLAWVLSQPAYALADAQLALERGCFNCHDASARRNIPSLAQLAARYARYQGQPEAAQRLAEKLRAGTLLGHIAAHERLEQEEAQALMRWLIEGAK